jgi:hypothetical protein
VGVALALALRAGIASLTSLAAAGFSARTRIAGLSSSSNSQ